MLGCQQFKYNLKVIAMYECIEYAAEPIKIDLINQEHIFGANHYERMDLVIQKSKDCWLYDRSGGKYLDCLAAYSAANLGHHHPKVVNALIAALSDNYGSVLSNVGYSDKLATFLKRVATFAPQIGPRFGDLGNKVLPKNGGIESVETAIKTARYYGHKCKGIPDGNQEIIVFNNSFHGRTVTAISFSTSHKYRQGFGPLTPGFVSVEYSNLGKVEQAITKNTCGILVEPMQGEGGMIQPQKGFLKGLRALCDQYDLFLMFDEIQVGFGRTGKKFCFEHENVIPDGLILGKAISGGLVPISVFVTNKNIMDLAFSVGSEGSTFGGYPLACVAGTTAIEVLEEDNLIERSQLQGEKLKHKIISVCEKSPYVKEVRGQGLFIGIEVVNGNAIEYCRELLNYGLFINDSHGHTIRVSPPLTINDDEIEYLCHALEKVLLK